MSVKTTARARNRIEPERWHYLKDIVADALEKTSATARLAFVEERCANDPFLCAEAKSLLGEAETLQNEPTDSLEDCAEQATANLWHDEPSPEGLRIGAYVIVRELGRGGMGRVYLAARADGQFEKQVAIKVLKRGTDTDEVLRRFASERHILARLDHPNIARLLDAGTTDDGLPYFVMEYVAGVPVTRFVREHELSMADRLAIFLKICAAVEVAHHDRVIHRDLKPGNILVNADGEPKLLDFGIAKLLTPGDETVELTAAAEQRLTPISASPEQADGRPVTEASDVYALGALLYEMISGAKPHRFSSAHPSREEIARVVREEEPIAPSAAAVDRESAPQIRGDLDAIVLFALRKEPECRYTTAADLAADILRHIAHEPVQARGESARYRAECLVARHRPTRRGMIVAMAAILFVLALVGALWIRSQSRQTDADARASKTSGDLPKSIAVLPFDNFGDNNPPSYFADGVQDNILTDLGKVSDLRVISRSGVAAYRGKTRDVRKIGRELGVANVLEGSVQISGERVRINAQLVDTRTDTQIWAEHYDRKIEDIFALQSELAQTIVAQLKATLSTPEKAAIWKRPTEDMQAYDLYLRARALFNLPSGDMVANASEAVTLVSAAVERDRKFALAYCLLADAQLYIYRWGPDHSIERLSAAKQAAEQALAIEPNLEEARLALARYFYDGLGDYHRTQEELSKIPSNVAHSIGFFDLSGLVQRRLGLWTEAIRNSEKAFDLDPQAPQMAYNLVQNLTEVRKFAEAERTVNTAIHQLPVSQTERLWSLKHEIEIDRGDLKAAAAVLEAAPTHEGGYDLAQLWLLYLERDFDSARTFVKGANDRFKTMPFFWVIAGGIGRASGDVPATREAYQNAVALLRDALEKRPDDPELLCELAEANAGLGRNEEALSQARHAFQMCPPSADAVVGATSGRWLAEVLTWTGNRSEALQLLSTLVALPFGPSYGDLKFNPAWDELRGDARFERLLSESNAIVREGDADAGQP